jgi:demethylmenaquinone methyltransferase / 2-methoxy-6-polyprenyl-1,4-benzoquinol methylase
MFDRIAPRYDRMNRMLTLRMDQRWRRRLVRGLGIERTHTVLDLACGTGDFAEMVAPHARQVIGLDFSFGMLERARERLDPGIELVHGDALNLPLETNSIDVAVSGFALRNLDNLPAAFAELARVVRPGGRLGLLEVDRPASRPVALGHSLYFDRFVPLVGSVLSDRKAYQYLPKSTTYLPPEPELLAMIRAAGFGRLRKRTAMMGAAQLIVAVRT